MIQIPELVVTRLGGELLPGESGSTDYYVADNDGNAVVQVHNPTGGALTLTQVPTATIAGLSLAGESVTVAAGAYVWIGPLPPAVYNDSQGDAHISDPSGALVFTALRF